MPPVELLPDDAQHATVSLAGGQYVLRFALTGRYVAVRDLLGEVRSEGVVQGVDDEGRLLVRGASGVTPVVAGEVTLRS